MITKNITYMPVQTMANLVVMARKNPSEFSPGEVLEVGIKFLHTQHGVQLRVSESVQRELSNAAMSMPGTLHLPWPTIEFYFDDPKVPTFLLADQNWLPRALAKTKEDKDKHPPLLHVLWEQRESSEAASVVLSTHYTLDDIRRNLDRDDNCLAPVTKEDVGLSAVEQADAARMVVMAYKYIAAAEAPNTEMKVTARKAMTTGGKPGIRRRPSRPALTLREAFPKWEAESTPRLIARDDRQIEVTPLGGSWEMQSPYAMLP